MLIHYRYIHFRIHKFDVPRMPHLRTFLDEAELKSLDTWSIPYRKGLSYKKMLGSVLTSNKWVKCKTVFFIWPMNSNIISIVHQNVCTVCYMAVLKPLYPCTMIAGIIFTCHNFILILYSYVFLNRNRQLAINCFQQGMSSSRWECVWYIRQLWNIQNQSKGLNVCFKRVLPFSLDILNDRSW